MASTRRVWASKIGTIPGPTIAVKGYASLTNGRAPAVGDRVEYKEARSRLSNWGELHWVADAWIPWSAGVVSGYFDGRMFLEHI